MSCPSVCGDNPRALASGLSYVQVDNMVLLFYITYISVDLVHQDLFHAKDGKGGIHLYNVLFLQILIELNHEAARYNSMLMGLGTHIDCHSLRRQLKQTRARVWDRAKDAKRKLIPLLRK